MIRIYLEMWRIVCYSINSPDKARKAEIFKVEDEFTTCIRIDPATCGAFVQLAALHQGNQHRLRDQAKVEFTAFFVQLNKVYRVHLDEIIKRVYNNSPPPLFRKVWEKCLTLLVSPNPMSGFGANQRAHSSVCQFTEYGAKGYNTMVSDRATATSASNSNI